MDPFDLDAGESADIEVSFPHIPIDLKMTVGLLRVGGNRERYRSIGNTVRCHTHPADPR